MDIPFDALNISLPATLSAISVALAALTYIAAKQGQRKADAHRLYEVTKNTVRLNGHFDIGDLKNRAYPITLKVTNPTNNHITINKVLIRGELIKTYNPSILISTDNIRKANLQINQGDPMRFYSEARTGGHHCKKMDIHAVIYAEDSNKAEVIIRIPTHSIRLDLPPASS